MVDVGPGVPHVVDHAPHVGVLVEVSGLGHGRLARRRAEHYGPAAAVYGAAYHLYLALVVGPRQVIDLHEVDAPVGIEFENRIVVFLSAGAVGLHGVVVRQPLAQLAVGADAVGRDAVGAQHGHAPLHRHTRHTAHYVYAELEAERVHIVGQRPESAPVGRRRKAVDGRHVAPMAVNHIARVGLVVAAGLVVLHKPADVDHHIFPAELLEMLRHEVGVGLHLVLLDRGAVAVPAVPAHGRRGRPVAELARSGRSALPGPGARCSRSGQSQRKNCFRFHLQMI